MYPENLAHWRSRFVKGQEKHNTGTKPKRDDRSKTRKSRNHITTEAGGHIVPKPTEPMPKVELEQSTSGAPDPVDSDDRLSGTDRSGRQASTRIP